MKKSIACLLCVLSCFLSCKKNTNSVAQQGANPGKCKLVSYTDHPYGYALTTTNFNFNDKNQIVSVDRYYNYQIDYTADGKLTKIRMYQGNYAVGSYLIYYYHNTPNFISGYMVLDGNNKATDTVTLSYSGDKLTLETHTTALFNYQYILQTPGGDGLSGLDWSNINTPMHIDYICRPYGNDYQNPFYTSNKENQFLYYFFSGEYAYQLYLPTSLEYRDLKIQGNVISVLKYDYQIDSSKKVIKRITEQANTPPGFTDFKQVDEDTYTYDCK